MQDESWVGSCLDFWVGNKTYSFFQVPLGFALAAIQASIYDVPGGYRAVMFDRFSGVKDKVTNIV
jgi:hypothetical protein